MTSCLLVKSPKRLVAVSDGRLSRDDNTQSFNETRKHIRFPISYQIPRFTRGYFGGFSEYRSHPWFLAYAGTHTATTEIIDLFRQRIGSLYLTRHEAYRHATLVHEIDTSGTFDDDYNFDPDEYLNVEVRDIRQDLVDAFEIRGSEFSKNRRERPDTQLILFGNEEASGEYNADIVSADAIGYSPGARLRIKVDPVGDGQLASLGSLTVANAAYDDQELMDGLVGWQKDEDPYRHLGDLDALDEEVPPSPEPAARAWSVREVATRFCQIIGSTTDPSVGGKMTVAESVWDRDIHVRVVSPA